MKLLIRIMKQNFLVLISFFLTLIFTSTLLFILFLYHFPLVKGETSVKLLQKPLSITGDKSFSLKSLSINPRDMQNKDTLIVTYNLHGLCMLGDEASEILLVDASGTMHGVSLAKYGKNCYNGEQSIKIPFRNFSNYTHALRFIQLEITFWYPAAYRVDIANIMAYNAVLGTNTIRSFVQKILPTNIPSPKLLSPLATNTPTATPSANPSITPTQAVTFSQSWPIQSVSSMKETKDKICQQRSQTFIEQWVDTAKDLGANYISIETPYDSPSCGDTITYTKLWISIIRSRGLKVWHRHTALAFEGLYSTVKDPHKNYLQLISDYITANPDLFQAGDIFTPMPEPQNGGIQGITYCPQNICVFSSAKGFNSWLRDAMDTSQTAFASIGLAGKVNVGYFGFDGFVTWGNNNPNWHGILEDATVAKMGNITIDHYPEIVGDTMSEDLNKLQKKYPNTPIVIGEWGTISGGDVVQQVINSMGAAKQKNIIGFNYWQMGMGGNEALINEDFSHKSQFTTVQSFYKSTK